MQYALWTITFVSLWLTIIWLSLAFFNTAEKKRKYPFHAVTIAVPTYNGGKRILRTLKSLRDLDYPKDKLRVMVVDDGSTDNTKKYVDEFIAKNKAMKISFIKHKQNQGKGAALQHALEKTITPFFACVDCDSTVKSDALKRLMQAFIDKDVAAVIPSVKVESPKNVYEKAQRVEYLMSNLVRHLLAKMGTLFLTHGVLAVFRVKAVRAVGGFDTNQQNITEDLEIAMRLRSKHYLTSLVPEAVGYTKVPNTFGALWRQRVRWFRGFIYNHNKFKHMIGRSKFGLFGTFQLPLNIIGVALLLVTVLIVSFGTLRDLWEFIVRSFTIQGYFWKTLTDFPTLQELLLGQNIQVILPIILGTALGIWLIVIAHKRCQEKIMSYIGYIWLYFLVSPTLTSFHWVSSITNEIFRTKRKW